MSRQRAARVEILSCVRKILEVSLHDGHIQPNKGKGEQRLVDPAHHDADILIPVLEIAEVGQSAAHVPCQE